MQLYDADVASAPSVNSEEFWKRPERVTASSDPDTATAQTIRIMCGHVAKASGDSEVRAMAADALHRFRGLSGLGGRDDPRSDAAAAWWWCKTFIKLVHHESILRARLGEAGHLQGLISPEVLVRMDKPEGDCAIFSECVCAFLKIFGIPYEFVTVAVNPHEPEIFSHVFVYGVMPDGSRLPLDASHGKYPGWQVPSSDVYRRQVWDASGNPVQDRGSRFDGLHNYGLRGMGAWVCPDPSNADTCFDDGTGSTAPTTYYNPTQVFGPGVAADTFGLPPSPGGGPGGTGFGPAAPPSGFNVGGFLANLANQWTAIGGRVIAPQTTLVRGPNGQLMYSTPASPSSGGVLPTIGSSSSVLWIAGAAVVGLFVVSQMGKR